MASKKFRGCLCVYCAQRVATTRDHVFARQFFSAAHRANLPLAPACRTCNHVKSRNEQYLVEVLPFGSLQPEAPGLLLSEGARRINANDRLRRELAAGMEMWQMTHYSSADRVLSLPFDTTKLESLAGMMARGLAFHHWGFTPGSDQSEHVILLTQAGSDWYNHAVLGLQGRNRLRVDLGKGVFVYEGIQGATRDDISVWSFSFFGGVMLGGDQNAPGIVSRSIAVFSAPAGMLLSPKGPAGGR